MDPGGPAHSRAARVRDAFVDAGFTVAGVADRLGPQAHAALTRGESVPARRVLSAGEPDLLAAFVRLFLLGEDVPRREATGLPVDDAAALGLLEATGAQGDDRVRARVDVRPYGESDTDWWVVSDRAVRGVPFRTDHVLGVGGASLTLARITPRPVVATALDVGVGCGVQALHLTRHVERVTVTDTNPRALELASLTAALSGVRWHPRAGSLFEPAAGNRYDLIVANPPFVISPSARFTYRDAGLAADDLGRRLLAGVPAHLAPGGWCAVLANWLHVRGQDWQERVAAWVEPTGCDAWVVQREVQDPAEYVETWLRDADEDLQPGYRDRYDAWLDDLAAAGAEAVGFGWVVLHAAGRDRPWTHVEDLSSAPRLPDGAEVLGWFARQDDLSRLDAVGLLDTRPQPAADLVVTRATIGGRDLPVRLGVAGGWRPDVVVDAALADVVARLDGVTTVGQAVDRVAAERGMEPVDLLAPALPTLRALLAAGALG